MKIIQPGHIYQLNWLDGAPVAAENRLYFVNREDKPRAGTQTQEVLRALIDRTEHCHACLAHDVNDKIIQHLRMALVLHEARALERKVEKGLFEPEHVNTAEDGHFTLVGGYQ